MLSIKVADDFVILVVCVIHEKMLSSIFISKKSCVFLWVFDFSRSKLWSMPSINSLFSKCTLCNMLLYCSMNSLDFEFGDLYKDPSIIGLMPFGLNSTNIHSKDSW